MTVRLTVDERAWHTHVDTTAATTVGLVPVVKGNGYGFGRRALMSHAAALGDEIAVGTVFEAADVPVDRTAVVLTPTLDVPGGLRAGTVLTVGSTVHVDRISARGWRGRVIVKLASSMQRFGARPGDLDGVLACCATHGLDVVGFGLHLPLAGSDDERLGEAMRWLTLLPPGSLWVSHLAPPAQQRLVDVAGQRPIRVRSGTALWHGDKSMLQLTADVIDVRPVRGGSVAGYRGAVVPDDGTLLVAGAGSTHGVAPLDDGRSPFHFARRRLAMLEPSHMHSTMLFVPAGGPLPAVGDLLDLQRPLIATIADEVVWV